MMATHHFLDASKALKSKISEPDKVNNYDYMQDKLFWCVANDRFCNRRYRDELDNMDSKF